MNALLQYSKKYAAIFKEHDIQSNKHAEIVFLRVFLSFDAHFLISVVDRVQMC